MIIFPRSGADDRLHKNTMTILDNGMEQAQRRSQQVPLLPECCWPGKDLLACAFGPCSNTSLNIDR